MSIIFIPVIHYVIFYTYCGWLRNPAPPKGWLRPQQKSWDFYHLSAGCRSLPTTRLILGPLESSMVKGGTWALDAGGVAAKLWNPRSGDFPWQTTSDRLKKMTVLWLVRCLGLAMKPQIDDTVILLIAWITSKLHTPEETTPRFVDEEDWPQMWPQWPMHTKLYKTGILRLYNYVIYVEPLQLYMGYKHL